MVAGVLVPLSMGFSSNGGLAPKSMLAEPNLDFASYLFSLNSTFLMIDLSGCIFPHNDIKLLG
jgi:hypothetical protein